MGAGHGGDHTADRCRPSSVRKGGSGDHPGYRKSCRITGMDAEVESADGLDWTWMSTDAVAHRLGVATKTVYRLIDGGKLRAFRIGRVIRLKSVDVDAYEASCEISPGTLGHLHGS